jgi:hypothetical protein
MFKTVNLNKNIKGLNLSKKKILEMINHFMKTSKELTF